MLLLLHHHSSRNHEAPQGSLAALDGRLLGAMVARLRRGVGAGIRAQP